MSNDYISIFIPETVTFIPKSDGTAWVTDSKNKKSLEAAHGWADRPKWNQETRTYEAGYIAPEIVYTNGNFKIKILDAANSSSQGGKLSFWTCLISTPDKKKYKVGINSDLLCDFIINSTLKNGESEDQVFFGTVNGQYGIFTESMPSYQTWVKAEKMRKDIKSGQTVKYEPGEGVRTLTINEFYIGTIYKYFECDYDYYRNRTYNILIYKKPKLMHVFASPGADNKLGIAPYCFTEKKPKRQKTGEKVFVDNIIPDWLKTASTKVEKVLAEGNSSHLLYSFSNCIEDIQYGLDETVEVETILRQRIRNYEDFQHSINGYYRYYNFSIKTEA